MKLRIINKFIKKSLMLCCLIAFFINVEGCSKSKQEGDLKNQQAQKSANIVAAKYDKNLEAILGDDGLIYEILEDGDKASMAVATYNDVGLTDITVPEAVVYEEKEYNVTEIKASAFESNLLLEKIVLSKGLERIGESAFYSCPELKEVVFSDTI